ncbi:Arm DNA-binding domain-containing protein [Pseudoalteromonas issachenkonii]|uniref:Arm DNA-binding domain-containing protein n=1 Tax=Pseudoalteromonas issachenkonii TaxID=152297 RepID=A0ABU9H5D8_9GAMM
MKFTDKSIKALQPKQSRYVLTENGNYGEGRLKIQVNETGTKTFRVQYHFNTKRKVMGIGTYPAIDLKQRVVNMLKYQNYSEKRLTHKKIN